MTFAVASAYTLLVALVFSRVLPRTAAVAGRVFGQLHAGLIVLLLLQLVLVAVAKSTGLPLSWASGILFTLSGLALLGGLRRSDWDTQALVLVGGLSLAMVALGQFGAPVSKWDGNAHLTLINAMTAENTPSLAHAHRLDVLLQPSSPLRYYPYLAHSFIATLWNWVPSELVQRPALYLASSVMLALAAIAGLVSAVRRATPIARQWHAFAVFALGLMIPALFFSAVHHGSFSRAMATTLALTSYLCVVGRFRRTDWMARGAIGGLSVALHSQGAVLVFLLACSEFLVFRSPGSRRRFLAFLGAGVTGALIALVVLAGEGLDKTHLDQDIVTELMQTWRAQIITDLSSFLSYSAGNVLVLGTPWISVVVGPLMLIGMGFLVRRRRGLLGCVLILFVAMLTAWIVALLLLPDGPILRLLAVPFVGVLSRPYEGIGVVVAFLAGIGLVRVLRNMQSYRLNLLAAGCVALLIGLPAMQVQRELVTLADHFGTLPYKAAAEIRDALPGSDRQVLVIADQFAFFALGDGKALTSYLAYYDCPSPAQNDAACIERQDIAGILVAAAGTGSLPGVAKKRLQHLAATYDAIYVLRGDETHQQPAELLRLQMDSAQVSEELSPRD